MMSLRCVPMCLFNSVARDCTVKKLPLSMLKLGVAPVVLGIALAATPSFAQDTIASASAESGDDAIIIVTGSRIRQSALVGLEPTATVSSEYIENRNLTNLGDVLNENPIFRGSVTPAGTQSSYGNGVNFINTFGLGSNRTLTLVNGRRVVSSNLPSLFGPGGPGIQVDLNIIPTILIDRIDEVSIGGAPVYGSDAIAGTVNVILKDNFQGAEIRATSGISSRGDAFNYNLSGVVGQNFAEGRGNITLAASYDKLKGVRGIDRKHIRDNIGTLNNCTGTGPAPDDGRLNPNIGCNNGGSDGVPGSLLFRDNHSPYLSSGGVIFDDATGGATGFQFGPDGNLVPVIIGNRLTGFFASGGNTYQTSDQTQVTSDLRRFTANLFASYELVPNVTLFFEGLYYNAQARELGQSPSFNTWVFDPDTSGGLSFDTATVPFLTDSARQGLLNIGVTEFNLSRSNEDLFDQSAFSKTELKRGVIGVRGDFDAAGRSFNYEVSFNYGENEIRNFTRQINQQRFINAVSMEQGPNGPVCSLTPTIPVAPVQPVQPIADSNCVPLNLFGFGRADQAALKYIAEDTTDIAKVRQWVFNANIGGELFNTWAGPVGFNIGYEHRDEKASFTPDSFNQFGGGRSAAVAPTAGQFNLDEIFGEVLIPLASPDNGLPFLYSAEAFGRVRYVNNTVNGSFTSWAAGGKVSPIRDIQIRGNFTRSFRAPAITELFLPQSPTFVRPPDLCREANRAAGPVPDVRTANCNAFLSAVGANPATYVLLATNASVSGLDGGNPNLTNEKADSYTFGGILQPRFIPGLTIAADYVNIKITGPITSLSETDLASACFDNTNFNTSDPRNGNAFCSQLGFDATGQIPNTPSNPAVRSGFVNGQQIKFEGITGAVDYTTRLSGIGLPGRVNVGVDALYVLDRLVDNTGVAPTSSHGRIANSDPVFSAQARFFYYGERAGFGTTVNYTGRQLTQRTNRGPNPNDTREFDHYKPYVTVNANVFFKTEDGFRFNVAVTNLFDRIGQKYYGYIVPASVNDDIGRRFSASITKSF